jgi:hypothetical protein
LDIVPTFRVTIAVRMRRIDTVEVGIDGSHATKHLVEGAVLQDQMHNMTNRIWTRRCVGHMKTAGKSVFLGYANTGAGIAR